MKHRMKVKAVLAVFGALMAKEDEHTMDRRAGQEATEEAVPPPVVTPAPTPTPAPDDP